MNYYIATALENHAVHNDLRDRLAVLDHHITYDWTVHGSVQAETDERKSEVATAELEGVKAADFVVVLLPGGFGTHGELVAALALGKRVFVWGRSEDAFLDKRSYTCVFYYHPNASRHVCPLPGIVAPIVLWSQGNDEMARSTASV